jgi:putative copper export protein
VFGEVLLGSVRLAHALAAALWVGGTLVYAFTPSDFDAKGSLVPDLRKYREALRLGIGVFVVSGALLAVERLGSAPLPPAYFAILVVKVALGIWMFAAARHIGAARLSTAERSAIWSRAEYRVLALGIVIYALALALRSIYEGVIRA